MYRKFFWYEVVVKSLKLINLLLGESLISFMNRVFLTPSINQWCVLSSLLTGVSHEDGHCKTYLWSLSVTVSIVYDHGGVCWDKHWMGTKICLWKWKSSKDVWWRSRIEERSAKTHTVWNIGHICGTCGINHNLTIIEADCQYRVATL